MAIAEEQPRKRSDRGIRKDARGQDLPTGKSRAASPRHWSEGFPCCRSCRGLRLFLHWRLRLCRLSKTRPILSDSLLPSKSEVSEEFPVFSRLTSSVVMGITTCQLEPRSGAAIKNNC